MKLIINADDYGMNPNCTRAITECLRRGWITNTTVMVNMPSCEQAVAEARQYGLLDRIGLHVNIYGGIPLTDEIRQERIFCGADGRFNHAFCEGMMRSWRPLNQSAERVLCKEVDAQFERYLSLGLPVRHFDSHHHSHMIMRILPLVCDIAAARGFKTARRGINVGITNTFRGKIYYAILSTMQCQMLKLHHLVTTQYMCNFKDFKLHFDSFGVDDTVELMVHPYYAKDGVLDDAGEMSDSGQWPMADVVNFVNTHRSTITLISYAQLCAAKS